MKLYFKNLMILGKAFCVYNTSKTGMLPVYKYQDNTYFKPRIKAAHGVTVNGVSNLVPCIPALFGGVKSGYNERRLTA